MKNKKNFSVGFIPLRAGSKGIPGKNKKKILGRPLYQWCLTEAVFSNLDVVYVFTNDDEIIEQIEKEYNWTDKIKVILRSENNASDTSSTEDAMLDFANIINWDFSHIYLLQATSPLTSAFDINKVIAEFDDNRVDSVLTVVNAKRFIWDNEGNSLNYNYFKRPRRQEFKGLNIENGAIYGTTKEQFQNSENRLGGKIAIVEMDEDTLTEIDELSDLMVIEKLLLNRLFSFKFGLKEIKLLVLDVDGVFTPGTIGVSNNGELFKTFSLRDGMGLDLLRKSNVRVIVMTSEKSQIVKSRMEKLQLDLFMGVKDKFSRLNQFLKENNLKRNQVAYVGDDINDLVNICSVGWSFAPFNAIPLVKEYCDINLLNNGGDRAIREVTDFIIKYNRRFV